VLEERKVESSGSNLQIARTMCGIIAADQIDLKRKAMRGTFARDLFLPAECVQDRTSATA